MSPGPRRPPLASTATRARLVALTAAALAACAADPVVWDHAAERRLPAPAGTAAQASDAAAESLAATGVLAAVRGAAAPASPASASPAPAPPATLPTAADPHACPASLRLAPGRDGVVGAVWWSERADHSAALRTNRSADRGRTWSAPLAVDTLDLSEAGCDRPAPSIAIDAANGYLHVAYSMDAPEGKGVFYAHQMDPRAGFERPQAVVYGDRPAATSVASAGDLVVVAYEDPNTGGRPFVSLALSHTGGHSFAERFAASEGSSTSAERPVVAVANRRVALGWIEHAAPRQIAGTDDPRSVTAAQPSGVVVRVGELRQ
ncbi:hypothetical protein tb265_08660 [Gemmatimonadetes bacterium T265]|nr:hypothetical protein tb265_08660 [Gemmatimonadetes bacterium T265]